MTENLKTKRIETGKFTVYYATNNNCNEKKCKTPKNDNPLKRDLWSIEEINKEPYIHDLNGFCKYYGLNLI